MFIIWKLFFRFCGFVVGFYCVFGEKDVFCLKFDIGKNFWSFFFCGKIYKGYFYVLFFSGFVGKFVVFWWDLEFFIIILKLVKFIGFWKIDFLIINYYDFF